MKTYLLLRNNRQSGPHSLEELLALGLKAHDLIWVNGHSASWRYPSEFDEFRALVAPPVGEPVLANEFTDAQNRILEAYPAEPEQPMHRDIPPVFQQPLRPLDVHGGVSVEMARESDTPFELGVLPAFQAIGALLEDEDMPTIALYHSKQPAATLAFPVETTEPASGKIADDLLPAPKPGKARIQVSLPAARADKTLVVIQRRDETGRAVVPPRSKPRRPVIEFLPDEQQAPEPVALSSVETFGEPPSASEPTQPVAVEAKKIQMEEIAVTNDATLVEEAPTVEILPPPADSLVMHDLPEETLPVSSGTLQVNISLVQKVAVAAAIISLLVVAGLIANALFNPRAYDYGNRRPAPTVSAQKQVSLPSASESAVSADTALRQSTVAK